MEKNRLVDLLAYAKVCFDKCTSPFESTHLIKKNVAADECRELSFKIADIIEEGLYELALTFFGEDCDIEAILSQAEKEFDETQP